MATIQTKVQITGDATGAKKALSDVQRSMNDMTQKARNMGNVIKGATRPDSIADMGMYLGKLSDQAKTATGSIGAISSLAASFGGPWGVALAAVTSGIVALANKFDWFGDKAKKAGEDAAKAFAATYASIEFAGDEAKLAVDKREAERLNAESVEKQIKLQQELADLEETRMRFVKTGYGSKNWKPYVSLLEDIKKKTAEIDGEEMIRKARVDAIAQREREIAAAKAKTATVEKAAKVKQSAEVVEPGVGSIAYFEKKVAEATKAYKEAISAEEREIYKQDIQFFQDIIDTINGKSIEIEVDTTELEDTLDLVDTKIEDTFNTKAIDAVSKTFGDMSSALGEYADDSKSAAQAQKALFMAEHAAAFASAIANGAKLPWPENLAAIGSGVAAVVAAFAQATKFANGGIVGGNSHNDGILARVSSGEMILNKNEQSNLFRMLRNGTTTGAGDVNFVITGDSLQGTLNNRNRTINRMR